MSVEDMQVEDDGEPSTGKYFQIAVPKYSGEETDMHSFLRLGKNAADVSTEAYSKIGQELWAVFDKFYDTSEGPAGQQRIRAPAGDPINGPRPPEEDYDQADEPEQLFANAGWRDHCDGNRITTTGGDKVEIIRGNYQMIVLGRQPDISGAVITDHSGGHETTSVIAPGNVNVTRIEWVQDMEGTWRCTEVTEKGDTHAIFIGDQVEEFEGGRLISLTGAYPGPLPNDPGPTPGDPTGLAPVISSGTLATLIEDYTGTPSQPVPTIIEHTFAGEVTELFQAVNTTSTTTVTGTITETTTAEQIVEKVTANTTSTYTGDTTSTYNGDQMSTTVGMTTEHYFGQSNSMFMGGQAELFLGAVTSMALNIVNEFAFGNRLSFDTGIITEVSIALKNEITIEEKNEIDRHKIEVSLNKLGTAMLMRLMSVVTFIG